MSKVKFGIIGGGWRAEFFLRIAKALPEWFEVSGVVVRDEEKGRLLEKNWGVASYRMHQAMLDQTDPDFVVVSVPWQAAPSLIVELCREGVPVLSETPPAPDVEGLIRLYQQVGPEAKVQVAEQYAFQPLHAAQLFVVHSGKLGSVTQAQVSAAHGYHGISLIRKFLGVTFEEAEIHGYSFSSPIVNSPNRNGDPTEDKIVESKQVIASLQFGGKLGVFDFTGDQYFSWIRAARLLVRGEKGELNYDHVTYLQDYVTPVRAEFSRVDAGHRGNLEGFCLKGIMAGGDWVYRNPFIPGRLSDDEIAVATCLAHMHDYVHSGISFYSLAEASQDHYLSIRMNEAVQTRTTVLAVKQPWAVEGSGSRS